MMNKNENKKETELEVLKRIDENINEIGKIMIRWDLLIKILGIIIIAYFVMNIIMIFVQQ